MENCLTLNPTERSELPQLRRLYRSAFPRSERKPFGMLLRQQKKGLSEMLTIRENGRFCGLVIVVSYLDMVLIDFFAILPEARSGGIGGRTVALLKDRYADRRLFLEIEREAPDRPDADLRARRKAFYLRNGMLESGVWMRVYGYDMELLHADRPVSFPEYCALLAHTLSPRYYRIKCPELQKTF